MAKWDVKPDAMTPADVTALIRRLGNPPFGTETSERNLMAQAAAALAAQTARAEAAEAQVADLTAKLLQAADALAASRERSERDMALIVKCTADMQATIKENADLTAKLGAMRAALSHTADQALAAEIPVGYGPEDKGAWTQGYDAAIRHARAALKTGGA